MHFGADFIADLDRLFAWRRDTRHFRTDPVDPALIDTCLDAMLRAPSVGLSEPWRIVSVESVAARAACAVNFETCNADALAGYSGERARCYATLKLSGMRDAPVQLAIFCDEETEKGGKLGAGTMPEMRAYSVVGAIMLFWLSARARGIGVGWVSILDPERLSVDLDIAESWRLIGYLCVGWPEEISDTPELERVGWETRDVTLERLVR